MRDTDEMKVIHVSGDFIVIDKPRGMLSERPAVGAERKNCPDEIEKYLREHALCGEVFTVHRLDATTEGVMVYALNQKAAAELSRQITDGTLRKSYRAYITASPDLPESGEMRDWLFFDRRADKSFVVKKDKKGAKEALLTYTLGEPFEWEGVTLTPADIELQTGRTHQIRVQFASRKSPLAGDGKYGSRVKKNTASLRSVRLEFMWRGEKCVFEAE